MKHQYIYLVSVVVVIIAAVLWLNNSRNPQVASDTGVIPIIPDVPADAIPPLDSPRYDKAGDVDSWLFDDDVVLAVNFEGDARAYPIKLMNWHEIVNDTIGGKEVAVTYCPLCESGIVFDRHVDGRLLSFGNTGSLYESAMVMYDRETNSKWWQAGSRSIEGELNGTELTVLPSQMTLWSTWKQKHPDTKVLSIETGFNRPYLRDSFAGYDAPNSPPGFPVSVSDTRLPPKERIVGIVVGNQARAYPTQLLKNTSVTEDVGDITVQIIGDETGRFAEVFEVLSPEEVQPYPSIAEFWFSWFAAHQETSVYPN